MSVAAGMAVMQAMFEAEIAEVAGPKGKHYRNRTAVRHGTGKGSVTLGGRRVPVSRPRARTLDGREVPLSSYTHFAAEDLLTQVVMERMLAGVATRRHARTAEPVGAQVGEEAKSTSRSAISRRFVRQTETALAELMSRDLSEAGHRGAHVRWRTTWPSGAWWWRWRSPPTARRFRSGCRTVPRPEQALVRLAAGRPGRARPGRRRWAAGRARRRQGAVCGGARGVRRQGPHPKMSLPKRRNLADHLPDNQQAWVDAKLVKAFVHPDPDAGLRNAKLPRNWIRITPARPRRCAKAWTRCSPSPSRHRRPPRQDAHHVQPGRVDDLHRPDHQPQRHPVARRADGAALDRGRHAQRRTILPPHQGHKQMPQLVTALHRRPKPAPTPKVGAAA